jgi:hypothetical protein
MNISVIIPQVDNGKSKVTVYDVDGVIIKQKYNYGKGWGFKFLEKYNSIKHLERSVTGGELIYSTANDSDCTKYGREVEFAISKL